MRQLPFVNFERLEQQVISDEQIKKAQKIQAVERKIISILKGVSDPVKRARVLRAVIALHGFDERRQS